MNKIESLLSDNVSQVSGVIARAESVSSQSRIDLQENALDRLYHTIEKDFPNVSMYEISVEQNLEVFESIQTFSEALN